MFVSVTRRSRTPAVTDSLTESVSVISSTSGMTQAQRQVIIMVRMMMMMVVITWIEITNATGIIKVDFGDSVGGSFLLQGSNLGPGVVGWVVLEHLQTSKTSHHQSKTSTQNLISVVTPIILSTGDDHLLVQASSSQANQPPVKTLLYSSEW